MEWILIIVMLGGYDTGSSVDHIEFYNLNSCEKAMSQIETEIKTKKSTAYKPSFSLCVKK